MSNSRTLLDFPQCSHYCILPPFHLLPDLSLELLCSFSSIIFAITTKDVGGGRIGSIVGIFGVDAIDVASKSSLASECLEMVLVVARVVVVDNRSVEFVWVDMLNRGLVFDLRASVDTVKVARNVDMALTSVEPDKV